MSGTNQFADNLKKIQSAAQKLVAIQQVVKASGKISADEKKTYVDNLDALGVAAQALAQMNAGAEDDDFRMLITGDKFSGVQGNRKNKFPDFPPFKAVTKDEDENVGEETDGLYSGFDKDADTVQVNSPGKDASVAEAKPVGLAIAGKGGVASSKPSATAVVGPGGLAIARPSAVAIAGVSPEDVSNLGIPIPQKKIIKKNYSGVLSSRTSSGETVAAETGKYGVTMMHTPYGDIKVLIGPDYKDPNNKAPDAATLKTTMDYSKDKFNSNPNSSDEGEILAEDYQDADEVKSAASTRDSQLSGAAGDTKYDELMAVAPEESLLNRYPLMPPKFPGYAHIKSRNSNRQATTNIGMNALYYAAPPPPPMASAAYNYPYSNLPFQAPMYFGY